MQKPQKYIFKKFIGEGGQSQVYLATRKSDDTDVVVICSQMSLETRIYGHNLTKNIDGFCKMFEHFRSKQLPQRADWACISLFPALLKKENSFCVLEYVGSENIEQYCKQLALKKRIPVLQRLVKAVGRLHQQNYYHLDLKPDNVLMRGDEPVIIDLGSMQEGKPFSKPHYAPLVRDSFREVMPAERTPLFSPETDGATDGARFDVYSLGCILYCCITETYFTGTLNVFSEQARIIHDKFGDQCLDLLCRMLHPDQCYRPKVSDVLLHPFFNPTFQLIRYNFVRQIDLREQFIKGCKKLYSYEEMASVLQEDLFDFIQTNRTQIVKTVRDDCLPAKYQKQGLLFDFVSMKQTKALQQLLYSDTQFDQSLKKNSRQYLGWLNHVTMLQNSVIHFVFTEFQTLKSITTSMFKQIRSDFMQFAGSSSDEENAPHLTIGTKPPPNLLPLDDVFGDLGDLFGAPADDVAVDYGESTSDSVVLDDGRQQLSLLMNCQQSGFGKNRVDSLV